MSNDDPTVLVSDDVIAEVLSKLEEPTSIEHGLDFANALLYHLDEALETYYSEVGKCQCLTTLQVADLHRGYCSNCFGAITVKVSGKAIGKWVTTLLPLMTWVTIS